MERLDPTVADALYDEPPDRFIAARNELAARLKEDGDVPASKDVSALRKPTVAAWAVDRLARDHAGDIEALIEAGKKLASAQREVAVGGGVDRLHEASSERRSLVDRLVRASAGVLDKAGMSSARATLDKVSNTLMAIATDEVAADRVRRGVLDRELAAPAGFGDDRLDTALLASVTRLPTASSGSGKAAPTPAQERKERLAKERADRLSAKARELEQEADRLERESKKAEAEAKAAAKAAATARDRADTARRRADDAAS